MEKSDIRKQVEEFMNIGGQEVKLVPEIPSESIVRLRANLVIEEVFEMLQSMFDVGEPNTLEYMRQGLQGVIKEMPVKVDIVEFVDACADIDYVVEGARLAFGINGKPIADEVQRTNIAKFGPGSWKDENGKIRKPPDWKPPEILEQLKKQGYEP